MTIDLLNMTVAAVLTLFVYSYLFRDNALYRIAAHLVVGLGVAYALTVAVHQVLIPKLFLPLRDIAGTVLALLSFTYTRNARMSTIEGTNIAATNHPTLAHRLGRWVLMIAFGAILGGTILTYTSVLVGRWDFLINAWLLQLVGLFT
jgi:hypothetical protein